MRFSIICGMALRDYWHERALSLCAVLALATVLAPLLILFGVRNGVISNLQERLLQDPRNLEIVPVGSGKYGKAFFEELRKRPDVGYVVPQTRAIAATIGLLPASEKKGGLPPNPVNVSLIPSGAGDPLTRRFAGNINFNVRDFSGCIEGYRRFDGAQLAGGLAFECAGSDGGHCN